jgi:hypothetical protein
VLVKFAVQLKGTKPLLENVSGCYQGDFARIGKIGDEWFLESSAFDACANGGEVFPIADAVLRLIHRVTAVYAGLFSPFEIGYVEAFDDAGVRVNRSLRATQGSNVLLAGVTRAPGRTGKAITGLRCRGRGVRGQETRGSIGFDWRRRGPERLVSACGEAIRPHLYSSHIVDTLQNPNMVNVIAWAKQTLRQRMQYPLSELSAQLNRKMKNVRFVLWWVDKEKKFAPGLFCQDLSTAMAVSLVSHIASPRAVAVCERCGNQFIRTKTIQLFCSLRCGNAERKARQRAGKRGKR